MRGAREDVKISCTCFFPSLGLSPVIRKSQSPFSDETGRASTFQSRGWFQLSRKSIFLVRDELIRAGIRADPDSLEAMDSPRRMLVWSRTHRAVWHSRWIEAITRQNSTGREGNGIIQTLSGSRKSLNQALIEAQNPDVVVVDTSDVSYYR